MRESAYAPRESDQHRLICLIRPSKKGVDDGERVNESVSQNAGPEISIRRHVCRSQDQKRQFRNKLFQPHVYNNGRNQTKQTRAQSQASKLLLISFHGRLSSLGLKERKYSAITRKAIGFSCSAESVVAGAATPARNHARLSRPRSTPSPTVMLGTRTDANKACRNLSQNWKPFQQAKYERERTLATRCCTSDNSTVNQDLHCLNQARRPFAARLHFA